METLPSYAGDTVNIVIADNDGDNCDPGTLANPDTVGFAAVPGARRALNANVLLPWSTFRVQNLVFLQKLSNDRRDWRFHQRF